MKKVLHPVILILCISGFLASVEKPVTADPCGVYLVNNTGEYFVGKVVYILNSTKKSTFDKLRIMKGKQIMIYAMCGTVVKIFKKGKLIKSVKAKSNMKIRLR